LQDPPRGVEEKLETLGEYLKRRREEKGISLQDIESVTKIKIDYLLNIEEERFESLPAPVFTLGFLKQYAQCIGLDPEEVILRYRSEVEKERTSSAEGKTEQTGRLHRRAFWGLLVAVCGLMFLWLFLSPSGKHKEERVRSIRFPRTSERELRKQQLREELIKEKGSPPLIQSEEEDNAEGFVSDPSTQKTEREIQDEGPVVVTLQCIGETRVKISVDGETSETRMLSGGDQVSWQAKKEIQLEIGNGKAVRIFYKGKVYENLGHQGEVVHIVFPPPLS
jgi:cytoskeletal protein RodZ